ncbi:MAG TPA: hypothetical protein DCM14_02105 [Clostridiales bacterium UBA8153]|nr:hypothetical protein [Clostridiales bacterium UBA8153]
MIVRITRTSRQGMSGPDIRFLQELLRELGFFVAATVQAVHAFQQARGLPVDGSWGPRPGRPCSPHRIRHPYP